jgi:hypothetical protein
MAAVADRTMWLSGGDIEVVRVRALQFHCPTLCQTSYAADGKLAGAQMACVAVNVPAGNIQTYQASYDNSIPCDLHGGNIDHVEFFLTDQDDNRIDFQGSPFTATIRVFWADPVHAHVGEAGAEMDETIGIRDIQTRQVY